jgi:hypothetical protein
MNVIKSLVDNKLIISILSVAGLVSGYFLSVYYSFGYKSGNYVIGLIIMFVSIMSFPKFRSLYTREVKIKAPVLIITLSLIGLTIVMFLLLMVVTYYTKQNYLRSELTKNGIKTTAVVTGFEYESLKTSEIEYATIQYEYENNIITQRIEIYKNIYKIDQTIPIRFSSEHPEMFEIIEDEF